MIGTALKKLAAQYRLTVNGGMAYGYLFGSFVTLTEGPISRVLSIYVGSVNVPLPQGETLTPAAKCSAIILDMVKQANGEDNVYGLMHSRFVPVMASTHNSSVVTLHFRPDAAGAKGLERFLAEQLPRITPLTAPLQCIHCGGHTHGQGYPVRISAGTVVPMHADCLLASVKEFDGGKPLPGILGAVVGALIGAFFWAGLQILGMPAVLGAVLLGTGAGRIHPAPRHTRQGAGHHSGRMHRRRSGDRHRSGVRLGISHPIRQLWHGGERIHARERLPACDVQGAFHQCHPADAPAAQAAVRADLRAAGRCVRLVWCFRSCSGA